MSVANSIQRPARPLAPRGGHWLDALIHRFRCQFCRHAFRLADLSQTGIPEPAPLPSNATYEEGLKYYAGLTEHPSHTRRVQWPCAKCGKVFFAHCGLDISPEHGPIIPPLHRENL